MYYESHPTMEFLGTRISISTARNRPESMEIPFSFHCSFSNLSMCVHIHTAQKAAQHLASLLFLGLVLAPFITCTVSFTTSLNPMVLKAVPAGGDHSNSMDDPAALDKYCRALQVYTHGQLRVWDWAGVSRSVNSAGFLLLTLPGHPSG